MGETVLYSTVKFKKGLRQEATVTQDEDVTYAEVRSSNPTSSDTVCPSAAAERSAGSSHPYRRAAVCVGLLCVLLLTATLVLCVLYTSLSQSYSLLERELEELRAGNSTMTQERDQLQRDYSILKKERNQLETNYTRLKTERDQQERDYNRLNEERDQLQRNNYILQLAVLKKFPIIDQYCPISSQKIECKPCPLGWVQFYSKCYFFSTEKKSWTESRIHCIKRGADLVIIKSKEEQGLISRRYYYNYNHWIGLSYTGTEGTWLWVDGSPLLGGFWREGDPKDRYRYRGRDCVATGQGEKAWIDADCKSSLQFICETNALLH